MPCSVLAAAPDDVEALGIASESADALGDRARADSWRRVRRGLLALSEAPEVAPLPEPPDDEAAVDRGQDWDGWLDDLLEPVAHLSGMTLADVGGLEDVKDRLRRSFLDPLQNPSLRRMYGTSLRGGLLLWGPPGCGKTFIACALAGELGAAFISIGLHDVLDMYLGNSERNMHQVFEAARRAAPCVLFFDEVDALGQRRTNLARSAGRNVVAQLLVELDGATTRNEGVFVLGATNQPWDVDPALQRPGRFDRRGTGPAAGS